MTALEKIIAFSKEIYAKNNDGHGFDHILRVVALAEKILVTEPAANRELVLEACYLHDSYDEKLFSDVATQKQKVANFLTSIAADKAAIFEIIDHMSFSSNLSTRYPLELNGQIVQDADRLDAMGAVMIVRTLQYGWAHARVLYDPEIPPHLPTDKNTYHSARSTTLNHFHEKAFLLYGLLNTAEARRIGKPRDKMMRTFVAEFEREWQETHGETKKH
ncbi:MAG: HD domain-containing protein [Streptococcaceae bacterium]|jgi:uncharacterized protein|nr:HD domain-containing protein [Streptococcaceae bacterium]